MARLSIFGVLMALMSLTHDRATYSRKTNGGFRAYIACRIGPL
jgi:hypothetical protein